MIRFMHQLEKKQKKKKLYHKKWFDICKTLNGENFKQLNEAVGALLSWQDQHKDHVEKLTDQLQRSLDGIESETRSVSVLGIGLPAEITEDGVAEINEGDFGPEMADRISAVEDM